MSDSGTVMAERFAHETQHHQMTILHREVRDLTAQRDVLLELLIFYATAPKHGTHRELELAARTAGDTYTRVALRAIHRTP